MTDEQRQRDEAAFEAFMAPNKRTGLVIASDVWRAACAYARREAVPCKGVPAPGCKYLMACGCICNKCGQIHDDELRRHAMLAAAPPAPNAAEKARG